MSSASSHGDQLRKLSEAKAVQRELLKKAMAQRFGILPMQQRSKNLSSEMRCTMYASCSMFGKARCGGQRPNTDFVGKNCRYYQPLETSRMDTPLPSSETPYSLQEEGVFCSACGAAILENSMYCTQCGNRVCDLENADEYPDQTRFDERVFNYIVQHDGDVLLSKACHELGLSREQIESSFGRLKLAGRIS